MCYRLRPEEGGKGSKHECLHALYNCLASITYVLVVSSFPNSSLSELASSVFKSLRRVHCIMEISKSRPVSSTVVFLSIFLSVICFAGLIHVEIELHVQRQMIQVLNQQREEKLKHRDTAHENKISVVKVSHSDTGKGKES